MTANRVLTVCEAFFSGLLLDGAAEDPGLVYDWGESSPFVLAVGEAECDNGTLREIARESAQQVPDSTSVTPDELRQWIATGRAVVVDVRTAEEFAAGHIPNARWAPGEELKALPGITADDQVVLVCRSGSRSRAALKIWRQQGFNRVCHLQGGMMAWSGALTMGAEDGDIRTQSALLPCAKGGGG